jgi:hypothetical protein
MEVVNWKKRKKNCVSDKCFQAYFIISRGNPSSWKNMAWTIRRNMQTCATYRYHEPCVNLMLFLKFLNGLYTLWLGGEKSLKA